MAISHTYYRFNITNNWGEIVFNKSCQAKDRLLPETRSLVQWCEDHGLKYGVAKLLLCAWDHTDAVPLMVVKNMGDLKTAEEKDVSKT